MSSRSFRGIFSVLVIVSLLLLASCSSNTQTGDATDKTEPVVSAFLIGPIYTQPVNPGGKLLLSSWLDPDGSDQDQYIWDNFTLQSNETITQIDWFGVYDPLKFGAGGPVIDFGVSIYPSISAGTEPAVAGAPLVEYQTGGNAGETPIGMVGTATLYAYSFSLPTSFMASAGVKYWVQIEASQQGSVPDWCLAAGAGGNGSHFRRESGAGGDVMYRSAPGDAAFTLLGPIPDIPTPTDTPTETPTNTPVDTVTPTASITPTATQTATHTPTFTPTDTPTNTPTYTPTFTPTNTSTHTPTITLTDTPTATQTPTDTPTNTPTYTPTPTPIVSTPGKVTGGGNIGLDKGKDKITFGFNISYKEGDSEPQGNLTYQDHQADIRLKVTSFDLLVIEGTHVWFTGIGVVNDGQVVTFRVEIDVLSQLGQSDTFHIHIPALNGYADGGVLTGGNITIH
jgi:hypothetical protein